MFYEKEDQSNEKTHKILFTGLDGKYNLNSPKGIFKNSGN
jgi:hypothetical protein